MNDEIQNAIIKAVTLSTDDHGCLSSWITLDYGGSGQGFGGYALYRPKNCIHHALQSVAGHFIWRVMEIAGVTNWNELEGKTIRAKCSHTGVSAIGHIVKDDWFNPTEDFKEA